MDTEHPAGCHQLCFESPQVCGTSNIAVQLEMSSRFVNAGTFRIDAAFESGDAGSEVMSGARLQ